ncbi:MAG: hypothetical protein F9B45_30825 [Phycisphaera sp. RhM]|nr:hypothetical protein [Phycisphaera sp. RhM]
MNDKEKLSTQEVANRITVGMGLVYDLYNEVVTFLRIVKESVESSVDASCLTGKGFKIPLAPRKQRTPADIYVSTDLGLVYELDTQGSGEEEEEDNDEASDSSDKGMQVTADSRFLVFRVQLYDRTQSGNDGFQPSVIGAVLTDSVRTKTVKGKDPEELKNFTIRRAAYLKILRKLDRSTSVDQLVSIQVPKGRITNTVAAVHVQPLAEFDSEESVAAFVQKLLPSDS